MSKLIDEINKLCEEKGEQMWLQGDRLSRFVKDLLAIIHKHEGHRVDKCYSCGKEGYEARNGLRYYVLKQGVNGKWYCEDCISSLIQEGKYDGVRE